MIPETKHNFGFDWLKTTELISGYYKKINKYLDEKIFFTEKRKDKTPEARKQRNTPGHKNSGRKPQKPRCRNLKPADQYQKSAHSLLK